MRIDRTFYKETSENFPVIFGFADVLETGDTVSSAVVTTPTGLTASGSAVVNSDGDEVAQRITSGTSGLEYIMKCLGTTTNSRVFTKRVKVLVY